MFSLPIPAPLRGVGILSPSIPEQALTMHQGWCARACADMQGCTTTDAERHRARNLHRNRSKRRIAKETAMDIPKPTPANQYRHDQAALERAMVSLGVYIREFRVGAMRLTIEELAEKSGVHRNTLSRMEQGGGGQLETFLRVMQAMGALENFVRLSCDQDLLARSVARTIADRAAAERRARRAMEND